MEKYKAAIDACTDCMTACSWCLDECIGQPKMERCGKTSRDSMLSNALTAQLLAVDGPGLQPQVKACIEICKICLADCEKFEDEHDHCRACAESCRRCIEELQKVAA